MSKAAHKSAAAPKTITQERFRPSLTKTPKYSARRTISGNGYLPAPLSKAVHWV